MRRCLPKPSYITNKLSRRPGAHIIMETLSQDLDTQGVAAIRTQTSNFWHIIYGEKRKIAFQLGPGMGVSLNCDCQERGIGRGLYFLRSTVGEQHLCCVSEAQWQMKIRKLLQRQKEPVEFRRHGPSHSRSIIEMFLALSA